MGEQIYQIYALIPKVSAAIGAIPKTQENKAQGFKFRGIDQFLNAAHKAFNEHGIFTTAEVLDRVREERPSRSGGVMLTTVLRVRYTFYAPDGSHVATITEGEGMDSGDKATAKAMSVSAKYAYAFTFNVPTEDIIDGDADDPGAHVAAPSKKPAKVVIHPAPSSSPDVPPGVKLPFLDDEGNERGVLSWDRTLASKYDKAGCKLCGKRHVAAGEPIVHISGMGWCALSCAEAHNASLEPSETTEEETADDLPF